jgi:hypothetical protein
MNATESEMIQEEVEAVAKHREVCNEEAAVETVGALEYQHLAVGRQQPKKWTQGSGGSRRKVVAARRQMTRHAIPAPHKGHGHQGPGRDTVARGDLKGQTLERR